MSVFNPDWLTLAPQAWKKAAQAWKKITKGEKPPAANVIQFRDAAEILQSETSAEPSLYKLLHWDTRYAATLPGRAEELQKLRKWAFDRHGFLIGILSGPGGSGKSRLAAEFCNVLAEHNWTSGFLRGLPPEEAPGWLGGSFCFVIDYAEEKGELLRNILERLRTWLNDGVERDVRILLLARENSEQQLRDMLDDADFVHEVSHIGLPPLRTLDGDAALELAQQVVDAVGGKNEAFADDLPNLENRLHDWLARDRQHGLPLFVIAATLHALMEPEQGFGLSGADLLKALARREMRRARNISVDVGLGQEALPRLLGLAVLAGGLDGAAIKRLRGQDGLGGEALNEDALRRTPWWDRERNCLALEAPDRPAAAFVAKALLEQPHTNLPEWLWLALRDVADDFAERLQRLQGDIGEFDKQTKERVLQALERMLKNDPQAPARARAFYLIAARQSHLTVPQLAVIISYILARHADNEAEKSGHLNNLSVHLSALGRREEALEPAREAVDIYRRLAQDNPRAFMPDLAMSLNNLANILSELGRREEALEPAQEAADIYRQLAEDNPQAFMPDLAGSLNNLAIRLSELGRREEALEPAQEAVDIYRRLAEDNPQAFMPDLAMSLNNLANHLSELGRREEALEPARKAVEIRRRLAEDNPPAFMPYLATSLNNLANRLSELGRREEALAPVQEAADIYRRLAEDNPRAFMPDLAMSLNNLANRLSELGRREEVLAPVQEAADIYRRLAEDNPQAFRPYLATILNNMATFLSKLGRREEALELAQEAVKIRSQLAEDNPQAFRPDLATSLGALGQILLELGQMEQAREAFAEGLRAIAPHAQVLPAAHGPLALALVRDYLQACEATDMEPDETLLALLEPVLAAQQEQQQDDG